MIMAVICLTLHGIILALFASLTIGTDEDSERHFSVEPHNISVILGSSVELPCKLADGKMPPGGRFQWTRDGFGLGHKKDMNQAYERYSFVDKTLGSIDGSMMIRSVSLVDSAVFQCQVSPWRTRNAFLNVWTAPESPVITRLSVATRPQKRIGNNEHFINVVRGIPVSLQCASHGSNPAANISWFDANGPLLMVSYVSYHVSQGNTFDSFSNITYIPTVTNGEFLKTIGCTAKNEVGSSDRVTISLNIQFPPKVSIRPYSPGMLTEGQRMSFECIAHSNPPPKPNAYIWHVNGHRQPTGGRIFVLGNITRALNNKHIRCSVSNTIGTTAAVSSLHVQYGPTIRIHPQRTTGDMYSTVTLRCLIDSNPPPIYFWTKDDQPQILGNKSSLTVTITEDSTGVYFCHGFKSGYHSAFNGEAVSSWPAEVVLNGPPIISSPQIQTGQLGADAHINCEARIQPQPLQSTIWKFHNIELDERNVHYRFIETPIENGIRSTLIVRQTIPPDFGIYSCWIKNSQGTSSLNIELIQKDDDRLSIYLTMGGSFAGGLLFLLVCAFIYLYRQTCAKFCCSNYLKRRNPSVSNGVVTNNNFKNNEISGVQPLMDHQNESNLTSTPLSVVIPSDSNEENSRIHRISSSSTMNGGFNDNYNSHCNQYLTPLGTNKIQDCCDMTMPRQPDVISYARCRGYAASSTPSPLTTSSIILSAEQQPLTSTQNPSRKYFDPGFSAVYRNPYHNAPCSTFSNVQHPFPIFNDISDYGSAQRRVTLYSCSTPNSCSPVSGSGEAESVNTVFDGNLAFEPRNKFATLSRINRQNRAARYDDTHVPNTLSTCV